MRSSLNSLGSNCLYSGYEKTLGFFRLMTGLTLLFLFTLTTAKD